MGGGKKCQHLVYIALDGDGTFRTPHSFGIDAGTTSWRKWISMGTESGHRRGYGNLEMPFVLI